MLTDNPIHNMERWGYHLLPQVHPNSPGYTGLQVAIRATPTRQHFDPETIQLSLLNRAGKIEETKLDLETTLSEQHIVCAGSIILCDRKDKQESFYCFNGTIESTLARGETVYTLRSSAPVLWLSIKGGSIADQLVAEFGRVIGEIRASAREKDEDFFAHLATFEPLALYTAGLCSIFSDYERVSALRDSYPDLHALLHSEKDWLQDKGLWPEPPTTLEELLGVPEPES